jgi:hypothetical protein
MWCTTASERVEFADEQWERLVALLDAQGMVADGFINYPGRGLPRSTLMRGGQLQSLDIVHALHEREADLRAFSLVHRQAMNALALEDGEPDAALAQALHTRWRDVDENPWRRLLGLLAAAIDEGMEIET